MCSARPCSIKEEPPMSTLVTVSPARSMQNFTVDRLISYIIFSDLQQNDQDDL